MTLTMRMNELTTAQSAEIERLTQKFRDILPTIYANLGDDGDQAILADANRRYDAITTELEAIVGEDGPCHILDPDKWEMYHNVHKSEEGYRPRDALSRLDVDAYLAPFRVPPVAA